MSYRPARWNWTVSSNPTDWGINMKSIAFAFSCLLIFSMPASANDADSFRAMVTLADKGNAEAQYHVGMMHNNGIGTKQDPRQAFGWFQKSTASGDPLGAYKLGCYYDGQGAGIVTPDTSEALKYKLISAKAGLRLLSTTLLFCMTDKEIQKRR